MIDFFGVSKIYPPNITALNDASFRIEKGEFVFLVGPSGSGKSTVVRLLLKEIEPTSGRLVVAGKEINRLHSWRVPHLRRNMGCVFQDFKLLSDKTVLENVAFALEVTGTPRYRVNTQVAQILKLVGLEARMDNFPGELSGGEQQRVSIARAIANNPPVLLADEPTGNLDPDTSFEIMQLLNRINRTGTTILVATHDRDIVNKMRKRVIALENGTPVRDQARGVYGYEV